MDLDEYINLKSRVETRMKISIMTSTGDDDLINAEEKGDLEYRREQLKKTTKRGCRFRRYVYRIIYHGFRFK